MKEQINELKEKYMKNNQVKTKLERRNQDLEIEEEHLAKKLEIQEGFYSQGDELDSKMIVGGSVTRVFERMSSTQMPAILWR